MESLPTLAASATFQVTLYVRTGGPRGLGTLRKTTTSTNDPATLQAN